MRYGCHSVIVAMNNKSFAPPSMAPRHIAATTMAYSSFHSMFIVNMLVMPRGCQPISLPIGPVADCV